MHYMDEYRARVGKCEHCQHHGGTGYFCNECYGSRFVDNLDFFTFVRNRVTEQAEATFDESQDGKRLLAEYNRCKDAYYDAKDAYEKAQKQFVENEIKRIEMQFNAIG